MKDHKLVKIHTLRQNEYGMTKHLQEGTFAWDDQGVAELPWPIAARLVQSSPFINLVEGETWPEGVVVESIHTLTPMQEAQVKGYNKPILGGFAEIQNFGSLKTVKENETAQWRMGDEFKQENAPKVDFSNPRAAAATLAKATESPAPPGNATTEQLKAEFMQMSEKQLVTLITQAAPDIKGVNENIPKHVLVDMIVQRADAIEKYRQQNNIAPLAADVVKAGPAPAAPLNAQQHVGGPAPAGGAPTMPPQQPIPGSSSFM